MAISICLKWPQNCRTRAQGFGGNSLRHNCKSREKWMSGRKYLDMAEYWQWRKTKEQGVRSVNQEAPAIKRVG
ncbi:MAG: hypothetical protein C6P37_16735 [Caldibacillus debilis]|uniref:Uncharacterized protein n=1 Tax=Caldibacillus debilis TaxID=301148 RepID=A0A3E0JV59_9BACI|nr:MAG: hypothetical protein C6W57_00490 [Caldibacillus debilis]REJ23780.1 MAG: hypothetical protein C6P37_16735 [Caldibacillus debilis]